MSSDNRLAKVIRETTAVAAVMLFAFCSIYYYPAIKSTVGPVVAGWVLKFAHSQPRSTESEDAVAEAETQKPQPGSISYSGGEIHLQADESGHFFADVYVNDTPIRVIVDTGATGVALTYEDAEAIGLSVPDEAFTGISRTANGEAKVAPIMLQSVRLGDIELENVQAYVAEPGMLFSTLLGMTFLGRLQTVQIRGSDLVLVP